MKYHVHLYQVASMAEVEVEADNETEAMQKALEIAGEAYVRFPDTGRIVIPFPNKETFDPREGKCKPHSS